MSDIVARLRLYAEASDFDMEESDMKEAAAEIERLRAENDHLRRVGMGRPSAELHEAALEELRDEIARLRARVEELEKALTEIAEYCCDADPTVSTIEYAALRALRVDCSMLAG